MPRSYFSPTYEWLLQNSILCVPSSLCSTSLFYPVRSSRWFHPIKRELSYLPRPSIPDPMQNAICHPSLLLYRLARFKEKYFVQKLHCLVESPGCDSKPHSTIRKSEQLILTIVWYMVISFKETGISQDFAIENF